MKNKVILGVFLLIAMLLSSYSVLAVVSVNIMEDSVSWTGNSATHLYTFRVNNTGTEAATVSLSILNPLSGPGGILSMTDLNVFPITPPSLAPGETATGQALANLSNAKMGHYTGIIQAKVGSTTYDFLTVNLDVTDNGQGFVVITQNPSMNVTNADSTVYQRIKVQNNANKDITVTVSKEGYDGMTFNVDRIGLQVIPAFGSLDITGSIVVPANKAAGTYTGRIIVTDGINTGTANLAITVLPTYKVSVSGFTISEVDPGQQKSVSFNIQNTGNQDIPLLLISNYTITDVDGDRINLTFSPSQIMSLAAGASASVTAAADVSSRVAPGRYTQQVTISGIVTQTFTATVEVNSLLQITEVEVDPDEVMPGEEFDVDVTVENTADSIDMRDVEVEVFIMDGKSVLQDDDDDDVKDSIDVDDLNDGDEETVTLTFTMPYNTEDGDSYTIRAVVRGKNDDDTREKYEDTDESVSIDVERDDHKVDIYKASLESSTLSCVKTTYIEVGLKDIGANDETVILTIKNDQLGLRVQDNFDMSSDYDDDEFEVEKSYLLDFTSFPAGNYPVTILAENDDEDKLGDKTVTVSIEDCSPNTPTTPMTPSTPSTPSTGASSTGTASTVDVVYANAPSGMTGATTVPAVSAASTITKAKTGSWTDSGLGTAVLILGNLLLVLLVVIAIMYMVGGSSKKDAF